MIHPDIIDALVAAGGTPEQIAAVLRADAALMEREREKKRERDRLRQQKHRAGRGAEAGEDDLLAPLEPVLVTPVTPVTRDKRDNLSPEVLPPAPPSPKPPTPPYPPTPTPSQPPARLDERHANPVIVLGNVLNPFIAKRFADHCREKRRPLSSQQAEGIAAVLAELQQSGIPPPAVVDLAISRGWTTIDANWVRAAMARDGPKRRETAASVLLELGQRLSDERHGKHG